MTPEREPEGMGTLRDRGFWLVIAVSAAALAGIWVLVPWQWSPVDDPGQHLAMRDLLALHGPVGAFANRVGTWAAGDWSWGIFRPLAWVYPPLLYWMPPTGAHLVRLFMLIIVVIGPLAYFRRTGAQGPRLWMTLALLVASAATLYQGLLLLSIQEVGGAMFVALGLFARRRPLRLGFWVLAAWFKGPFAWILLGYAVTQWREGRRRLALTSGAFGIGTLLVNVWWSRNGTYAARYRLDPFDPELWKSAANILEPQNAAIAVIVLWWLVATQSRLIRRPDFPIFLFAAVGYYVQMIPWGFTAYYMGPITFLFGLLLASMLTDPPKQDWPRMIVSLAGPVVISCWLVVAALRFVLGTNAVIADATDCLSRAPGSTSVVFGNVLYITSSPEGPLRLQQNVEIAHPEWSGTVITESNSAERYLDPATTHAIVIGQTPLPAGRSTEQTCSAGDVELVQLSQ